MNSLYNAAADIAATFDAGNPILPNKIDNDALSLYSVKYLSRISLKVRFLHKA